MFRPALSGVLAVLLLPAVGAVPARAADGDKDVKAIIAKAIEAKGGAANLEKYQASISKFKGELNAGGMTVVMTGTTKEQVPDKLRLDATMKVGDQSFEFMQVINGDKGWQGVGASVAPMEKDALDEARQEFHAGQIADLRGINRKGVKLTALGDSKVNGTAAVGVKVSAEGYRDISLFFDKATGQLLKTESKGKDPMSGSEFNAESFFSDYKKVSGVNVPHKVKVQRDGKPFMEMQMTSVTLEPKLDDKDFAKP
jgi:hypothetical protein